MHCIQQRLRAERLAEKCHGSAIESLLSRCVIHVSAYENDRESAPDSRQLALQFEPAHTRTAIEPENQKCPPGKRQGCRVEET
jgi:hypothetical protein